MRRAVSFSSLPSELTTEQAASLLGLGRAQIYKRLEEGAIPSHRVGKNIRLWKADVLALMEGAKEKQPRVNDFLALLLGDREEVTFEVTIRKK